MNPLVIGLPTLVLNRSWTPIQTTTIRVAISLVCKGAARIIDPDTYEVHDLWSWHVVSTTNGNGTREVSRVRSARLDLLPPEVIVLTDYTGVGDRSITFSRGNLFRRDGYRCQYCGGQPGLKLLTVDHVIPKSRGGATSWENCVIACVSCNGSKGNRLPAEAGMTLLTEPRKPRWVPVGNVSKRLRYRSWNKFLSPSDRSDDSGADHRCA